MHVHLLYLVVFFCLHSLTSATNVIYVDSTSSCTIQCGGSSSRAYPSLKAAINGLGGYYYRYTPTISVAPGVYKGSNNRDLNIQRSVSIKSTQGSAQTIIDCQGQGQGFSASNIDSLTLVGLTIRNCSASRGGAVALSGCAGAHLTDVVLTGNSATNTGGAVYASGNSQLLLEQCVVTQNSARNGGGGVFVEGNVDFTLSGSRVSCNRGASSALNDIACSGNADVTVGATSNLAGEVPGVSCAQSCSVFSTSSFSSLCGSTPSCPPPTTPTSSPTTPPNNNNTHVPEGCGDGICDLDTAESCLNCPTDCTECLIDGLKFDTFKCTPDNFSPECWESVEVILTPSVVYTPPTTRPIIGRFFGYFQVDKDGTYTFQLRATNMGARLIVDARIYVDAYFQQDEILSTAAIQLERGEVNTLEVQFFSYAGVNASKEIELLWMDSKKNFVPFEEAYYTIGNITANHTRQFFKDFSAVNVSSLASSMICGDGVCQETSPERCIVDCFDQLSPICPLQATPATIDGPYAFKDTLGDLIKNQYMFRFPGLEAITHGVDILTGDPLTTPLFSFSFCDNTTLGTVQDSYYGLTYTIPPEIFAQLDSQCSFQMDSNTYTSSSEMSSEMTQTTSLAVSVSASAKFGSFGGSMSAAYSNDKSVSAARSLEQSKTGSLVTTEVYCQVSKVQIAKHTFHWQFVRDVANAMTAIDMVPVIYKYGSHYFKSAVLGGKLKQVTIVDSSTSSSMSSSAIKESSQISFSASVSAPMFSAKTSFSGSIDTETTQQQQQAFEQSSTSSTVLTYGGPPGAYSPAPDGGASTFGSWAAGVAALPVPIDYELDAIGNIIPLTWTTPNGTLVRDIWAEAEMIYYSQLPLPTKVTDLYSLYMLEWHYSSKYTETLDYLSQMWTTLTIEGTGNTQPKCETILMDMYGTKGTYAPALWDAAQASNDTVDKTPRFFMFNCTRFSEVNKLSFSLNDPNSQVQLQSDYMVLYDYYLSRAYPFIPVGGDGVIAPLVMQPNYTHGSVRIHFKVTCGGECKTHPNQNPGYCDDEDGNCNEEPIQDYMYDMYVLKLTGSLDEIVTVRSMEPWPTSSGSQSFDIELSTAGYSIGALRSVSFQEFTSRVLITTYLGDVSIFKISDVVLSQTLCADGMTDGDACAQNITSGYTRIYSYDGTQRDLKRTLPSPLVFDLTPQIVTFSN